MDKKCNKSYLQIEEHKHERHTEATDNKNLKKNPIKVPAAVSNEQQPACLHTVMRLRMGRVLMANHLSELISLSGIVPVQWT